MQLTHWEATDVANYLLARPVGYHSMAKFQFDQELAKKGKQAFSRLGCVKCHAEGGRPDEDQDRFPAFASLRLDQGCLSPQAGNWPNYQLSESSTNSPARGNPAYSRTVDGSPTDRRHVDDLQLYGLS